MNFSVVMIVHYLHYPFASWIPLFIFTVAITIIWISQMILLLICAAALTIIWMNAHSSTLNCSLVNLELWSHRYKQVALFSRIRGNATKVTQTELGEQYLHESTESPSRECVRGCVSMREREGETQRCISILPVTRPLAICSPSSSSRSKIAWFCYELCIFKRKKLQLKRRAYRYSLDLKPAKIQSVNKFEN